MHSIRLGYPQSVSPSLDRNLNLYFLIRAVSFKSMAAEDWKLNFPRERGEGLNFSTLKSCMVLSI